MQGPSKAAIVPLLNTTGFLEAFTIHRGSSPNELCLYDRHHTLLVGADGSIAVGEPLTSNNALVYPVEGYPGAYFTYAKHTGLMRYADREMVLTSSEVIIDAYAAAVPIEYVTAYISDQNVVANWRGSKSKLAHIIVGFSPKSLFTAAILPSDLSVKVLQRYSDFDHQIVRVFPLLGKDPKAKGTLWLAVLFETGVLRFYYINLTNVRLYNSLLLDTLNVEGIKDIYSVPYTSEILVLSKTDILYHLFINEVHKHKELSRLYENETVQMGRPSRPGETVFYLVRRRGGGSQTQVQQLSYSHATGLCTATAEIVYAKSLLELYPLEPDISSRFFGASCAAIHDNGDFDLLFAAIPPMSNKELTSKTASLTKEITGLNKEITSMLSSNKTRYRSPSASPRNAFPQAEMTLTSPSFTCEKRFNMMRDRQTVTLTAKGVQRLIMVLIPRQVVLVDAPNGLYSELGVLSFVNTAVCQFTCSKSLKYTPFKEVALSVALYPLHPNPDTNPISLQPAFFETVVLDTFGVIVTSTADGELALPEGISTVIQATVPSTAIAAPGSVIGSDTTKLYIDNRQMIELRPTSDGSLQVNSNSLYLVAQAISTVTEQACSPALLRNRIYSSSLLLDASCLRSVTLKTIEDIIDNRGRSRYRYKVFMKDCKIESDVAPDVKSLQPLSFAAINSVHTGLTGISTEIPGSKELGLSYIRTFI